MEMGGDEGGLGLGALLAGAASLGFMAFLGYKISKKREEIRKTIELLNDQHAPFVEELQALVEKGELKKIVI
jgi:hypothetical protein